MGPSPVGVLLAEYATPDDDFADVENVLLYNVGSGAYSHLTQRGLICRRVPSLDELHRVSYSVTEKIDEPEFAEPRLASATLANPTGGNTPAAWWSAFLEGMQVHSDSPHPGEFAVDIELGTAWQRPGLVADPKALLDGFISALHVHDGSSREQITTFFGDDQRLWRMLNDPSRAVSDLRKWGRWGC